MKEIYIIREDNHGVIGVAESYTGVCLCLTIDMWLTPEEMAEVLKKGMNNFETTLEEHGIFLEKKELWVDKIQPM